MDFRLQLPAALASWIRPRPWLHVRRDENAQLSTDAGDVLLVQCKVPTGIDEARLLEMVPRSWAAHSLPLVTSSYLRRSLRELLEQRGIAYLDARGHMHLVWRTGLVHIDESAQERPTREAPRHLGVHGVRAVQAMLDQPSEILVTKLAAAVALSPSRTHTILKLLESEGLVRSTGTGPSTRRHVVDRARLLDWLAAQPAARRREQHLDVSLYARTPEAAWRLVRERLDRAAIPHALTGSAAAAALGAGPTSVIVSAVRIAPEVSLEAAARALEAEVTDRGANLRLVRDTGMVGTMANAVHGEVRTAPLPRVYLDALADRRGEDIAQQFRELLLAY